MPDLRTPRRPSLSSWPSPSPAAGQTSRGRRGRETAPRRRPAATDPSRSRTAARRRRSTALRGAWSPTTWESPRSCSPSVSRTTWPDTSCPTTRATYGGAVEGRLYEDQVAPKERINKELVLDARADLVFAGWNYGFNEGEGFHARRAATRGHRLVPAQRVVPQRTGQGLRRDVAARRAVHGPAEPGQGVRRRGQGRNPGHLVPRAGGRSTGEGLRRAPTGRRCSSTTAARTNRSPPAPSRGRTTSSPRPAATTS